MERPAAVTQERAAPGSYSSRGRPDGRAHSFPTRTTDASPRHEGTEASGQPKPMLFLTDLPLFLTCAFESAAHKASTRRTTSRTTSLASSPRLSSRTQRTSSRKSCCSKPASQPPRRLTLPSERVAYSPVLLNPAGFEPRSLLCVTLVPCAVCSLPTTIRGLLRAFLYLSEIRSDKSILSYLLYLYLSIYLSIYLSRFLSAL